MKPLAPTFSSLSTSRQIKTPGDRFVQGHFKCDAATLFQQVSSSCVIQRSGGAAFLCCSVRKPALPNQNQEVTAPSLSIRRFLAGYVQSQRPSGYPQPQLQGHLSSPWEKMPWLLGSFSHHNHYSTINPIMLQDFAAGLWFRRLQKRVRKISFFPYCIQDSPTSSFHLQKISLFPPRCKGHLSIFDLCWGDFTTPPSYYIGHLFEIFNRPPGSVEGKKLSPPRIGIVALSPPPGAW